MLTQRKLETGKWIGILLAVVLTVAALAWHYLWEPWGFYRKTEISEVALRTQTVAHAEKYLGYGEADGRHKQIVDRYNAHEPLAVDYVVQYDDSWCAVYVSTVAIEQNLTDVIPTECGCERQIGLWKEMGRWQEKDSHIPLPGDLIYYDWDQTEPGDCTGWSDHVGLVVGTKWPWIRVIEGNKDDTVTYRTILVNDVHIRGFGLPDYRSKLQ